MAAPRKSAALHDLHNTRPHDRAADASHVPAGRPKFPKDLGNELRPIFKRLCNLPQQRRQLTAGDAELIRLYCFQYERHEKNAALLRTEGELCTYFRLDSHGVSVPQVKVNLRLKVCTDAERQMAAILKLAKPTPTPLRGRWGSLNAHRLGLIKKPQKTSATPTPFLTMSFAPT